MKTFIFWCAVVFLFLLGFVSATGLKVSARQAITISTLQASVLRLETDRSAVQLLLYELCDSNPKSDVCYYRGLQELEPIK